MPYIQKHSGASKFGEGLLSGVLAELKKRQALKDAMEQFKTQQDLTLAKQKELATFNQGLGDTQRQDVFDTAQFGQRLTPDVVGSIAKPEELYGVGIPEGEYGPPTKEAYQSGLGGAIAGMRRKAAEYKQNVVQTPEDLAKQEAKRAEQERKTEADKLTAEQRQTYAQANIRLRQQLRDAAKGEGVDMKIIDKATAAYNSRYNTAIRSYTNPAQAQAMAQEAFDNVLDMHREYGGTVPGKVTPKDGTAGADSTKGEPTSPHDAEIDKLNTEYPTASPERKKAIKARLAAILSQS